MTFRSVTGLSVDVLTVTVESEKDKMQQERLEDRRQIRNTGMPEVDVLVC